LIVRMTDSFSEFWPLLADELKVPLLECRPADGEPPQPAVAVVVIAAGAAEPALPAFIPNLPVPSDVPIIAVGAATGHRLAAQAVAAGATDYFALPDDRDALRAVVAAAVARRRATLARIALARLEGQAHAFREMVGESPALRATLERAARVLPHADATVLITGETGTGKELLARANRDRKSTRLNSSHVAISYAVFCLKKKSNYSRAEARVFRRIERRVLQILPSHLAKAMLRNVRGER